MSPFVSLGQLRVLTEVALLRIDQTRVLGQDGKRLLGRLLAARILPVSHDQRADTLKDAY